MREVGIPAAGGDIAATLTVPRDAAGLVIFAHGSGSSRRSSRNRFVAGELNARRMATLLLDLLTSAEEAIDEATRALRFDIALLAERLRFAREWSARQPELAKMRTGYFGASTGAAAALVAAAGQHDDSAAIVSRGGRPDLAGDALPRVQAPTLLIVGSRDETVLDLNRRAAAAMRAHTEIAVVPGATHLFEEPGTLESVARLSGDWFARYLQ
jgi:putative phosphoribosyl transferase